MKILYTTHQFFPDYGAGTELMTYMTASQMRSKGHSVCIVTGDPSKNPLKLKQAFDEYSYDNLTVHRYRHSRFHPVRNQCVMDAEHNNTLVKEWFYQLLEKCKPDLVHVFHLQRISASVLEVCNELKIPYIITVTDFWIICPTTQLFLPDNRLCAGPLENMENCIKHLSIISSKSFVSGIVQKIPEKIIRGVASLLNWAPQLRIGPLANIYALTRRPSYILQLINQANLISVTNRFMQEMLQRHGVNSDLITRMPFGIQRVENYDASSRPKSNTLQIGFIGTLNYHKGAHVLIKSLCDISKKGKISLKIYGNREQFPIYVSMLDDMAAKDTRIGFKGTFPPDDIGRVLRKLDVLVVPSLWYENTPLIIHQAHAAKVPVIASDLGGMNDVVIDGQNGYLFEAGNVKQLSTIIESLIEDPIQLEIIRNTIESPMFIDQYADLLEDQYNKIIDKRFVD